MTISIYSFYYITNGWFKITYFGRTTLFYFVEQNAATALNDVMMSHLVLHVSNTRKYVMAVFTRIQGKLCDKMVYSGRSRNFEFHIILDSEISVSRLEYVLFMIYFW